MRALFQQGRKSSLFDGPTAAEINWQRKYGHTELRGDELTRGALDKDITPDSPPSFTEHAGAVAVDATVLQTGFQPEAVQMARNLRVEVVA